jgi:hypothetical protein
MAVARTTDQQRAYLEDTAEGRELLATLEQRIAELERRWGVRIGGPAGDGGTSVALVATDPAGRRLAVKLDPYLVRGASQAAAMAAWARAGLSPEVLATDANAYLMAWVDAPHPTKPLTDRQYLQVADALADAWDTPVPADVPLTDRPRWLVDTSVRRTPDPTPLAGPATFTRALELVGELRRAGGPVGVCHGDPVASNVFIGDRRVTLIDPVPHHDPLEAVLAHWAVRAHDGRRVGENLRLALRRRPQCDAAQAEGWAAVFGATYLSWLAWLGAPVDDEQRAALEPLR